MLNYQNNVKNFRKILKLYFYKLLFVSNNIKKILKKY